MAHVPADKSPWQRPHRTESKSIQVGEEATSNVFDNLDSRILTHWHEARMIKEGQMPPPRTAIVYPTYVCNQDCIWCEYNAENTNKALDRVMSEDNLRKLIWDLKDLGVKGIEFCGGGEPTMHPALAPIVRDMKRDGLSIGILTNGTKLYGELASALVDCASYVRVGFDGATPETANAVKRPKTPEARFERVCKNIEEMVALRNERGTPAKISIKVVLDQNNVHEIEQCVKLGIELGVDSVQFKAARLCPTELDPRASLKANSVIEHCKQAYSDIIVMGGTTKVDMHGHCWLTPLQVTVDTVGDVYLCCYYRHRKDKHTIGNCFTTPLKELWYSDDHWEAIQGIEAHECNNLDCRFVRYNRIMDEVMGSSDAQFEFI